MARARSLIIFSLLAALSLAAQEPAPGPRPNAREFLGLGPAPDVAAAKAGEPLYAENCAACHGKTARGAQGPNLIRSPLVLHDEKGEEMGPVIQKGRSQAGMPAFADLSKSQIYQIAEFIHLQIELSANRGTYRDTYASQRNQATGDPAKGHQFFAAQCAGCHSITGDLAGVGKKYPQASVMVSRIAWPVSAASPEAAVTTATGEKISGVLLKFDDFDIALKDSSGQYHAWPRTDVKIDVPDKLAGHRALLPKYTDDDLHNLTAFLETIQ